MPSSGDAANFFFVLFVNRQLPVNELAPCQVDPAISGSKGKYSQGIRYSVCGIIDLQCYRPPVDAGDFQWVTPGG